MYLRCIKVYVLSYVSRWVNRRGHVFYSLVFLWKHLLGQKRRERESWLSQDLSFLFEWKTYYSHAGAPVALPYPPQGPRRISIVPGTPNCLSGISPNGTLFPVHVCRVCLCFFFFATPPPLPHQGEKGLRLSHIRWQVGGCHVFPGGTIRR